MPAKIPAKWDKEVDVVVLGSGGAGLVAATLAHDGGAETLLLEKAPLIGGTTGVSGGMPWVPRNKHMAAVGVDDSREDALTRLTSSIQFSTEATFALGIKNRRYWSPNPYWRGR